MIGALEPTRPGPRPGVAPNVGYDPSRPVVDEIAHRRLKGELGNRISISTVTVRVVIGHPPWNQWPCVVASKPSESACYTVTSFSLCGNYRI